MITQAQYERLCAKADRFHAGQGRKENEDLADLLESFEELHAALDHELMNTTKGAAKSFELLYDADGDQRVTLVNPKGKTR